MRHRGATAVGFGARLSHNDDTLLWMAIPGVSAELPLRAKVRVGGKDERGYPTSYDHFECEHPDFLATVGAAEGQPKPTELRIRFPYPTLEECFPSGLERWVQKRDRTGNILTCYTKGDGVAHRLTKGEKDGAGEYIIDPTKGSERLPMPCRAQACPLYGKERTQGCRPKARLNFFLVDDPRVDSVYRLETQSLNTYGPIAAILRQYSDLTKPTFILSAKRVKDGSKHYTLVEIREDTPPTALPGADDGEAAGSAHSAAATAGESTAGPPEPASSPANPSEDLAARALVVILLEQLGQDPRDPAVAEWVKKVGYRAAADALEARLAARGGK